MAQSHAGFGGLTQQLAAMASREQRTRNPVGFHLKKPDGKKTSAVVVAFDDGSSHEIAVQ